jgi:hypothetical protein
MGKGLRIIAHCSIHKMQAPDGLTKVPSLREGVIGETVGFPYFICIYHIHINNVMEKIWRNQQTRQT